MVSTGIKVVVRASRMISSLASHVHSVACRGIIRYLKMRLFPALSFAILPKQDMPRMGGRLLARLLQSNAERLRPGIYIPSLGRTVRPTQ